MNGYRRNLLSTTIHGVVVTIDLDAYGTHAFKGTTVQSRYVPGLSDVIDDAMLYGLVLEFSPEFEVDRVTGETRNPVPSDFFTSSLPLAQFLCDEFNKRFSENGLRE